MHFDAIYLNLTSYQQCFYTLLCVCVYLVTQLYLTVCEWTLSRQAPLSIGIVQARIQSG